MKKTLAAALLGATLLAGTAAIAQDGPRPDPLAAADANKDGVVTREEMLADSDARFATLDANKDGSLTEDERGNGPGGGRMMGRADANEDGKISLEEQRTQANRRFDRMDTNKDGKIDKAEREAMRGRMGGGRGPGGDTPPPPPPGGGFSPTDG